MDDPTGPWSDYADTTTMAAPPPPAHVPTPIPHPLELAQPGTPDPRADDGPWSDYAPGAAPSPPQNLPVAPTAHNPTIGGFADTLPTEPTYRMSPKDEATYSKLLQTADVATLKKFIWEHGGFVQPGIEEYVANRDKARAKGIPVSYDVTYALPKVHNADAATGASGRGLARGATFNFLDEAGALVDAVGGTPGRQNIWNSNQSFGDLYDQNLDTNRVILGADDEDHPYASLAGELVGGVAVPFGFEKAGITASLDSVRIGARNAAIMEGYTEAQAERIASRAVTRRLAAEGSAYGGAYGAGSSDGGPGERLVGGATGALTGAVLPVVGQKVGALLSPVTDRISTATNVAYNYGRRLVAPFTKEGAQDQAATILQNSTTRPADDVVSNITNAPEPVPGSRPTLAEVGGDPGLAGLQRGHANTDLNTAAAVGERNASNALARTRAATDAMGEGSPQAIQDHAAGRVAEAERATADQQTARQAAVDARLSSDRRVADSQRATAEANLAQAVDKISPAVDREATGATARDAFDTAYEGAKARTSEAYSNPALTTPRPITIPQGVFMKLRQAADDFYGDGGGEIPARLQSILSDMADPHATTRTLTNIDRRLADFAGEARMQGRRSEAAFAERVRGDLGDFVQKAAPADYRAALTNAKAVRAEQGRVFETGDAAATFTRDRYGNASVGDTTVPTRLVRPGAPGGDTAERLIQAVGPDNAENIVRQEIRRVAEERGVQTAAQARELSTRYAEAAKRFPSVQADLDALEARAGQLDAARGGQAAAEAAKPTAEETASVKELSALHQRILKSPLVKVADPTVDPSSFVAGLLRRSDDGRQLRYLAGSLKSDPDAVGGLHRALADYIEREGQGPSFTASGDRIPSINGTRQAIDTVMARAGDTLTTQQKVVLRTVQRELQQANFAATASKPAGSETALNKTFVDLMSHAPGVPGKIKGLLTHVLGALSNRDEVKGLVTEAILNPDFAATLLKRPTASHWAQVQSPLIGRKATVGGTILSQPANDRLGLQDTILSAFRQSSAKAATPDPKTHQQASQAEGSQ